jgi:hypothetical protein
VENHAWGLDYLPQERIMRVLAGYRNIFLGGAVGHARGSDQVTASDRITVADNAQHR